MTVITFHRESNDFTDILDDPVLKKHIGTKLQYNYGLIVEVYIKETKLLSYINLKYGDSIRTVCKDRTPIPGRDYLQKKPPHVVI